MTTEERQHVMDGVYTHPRHNTEYRIHVWGEQFVTLRPVKEFLPVAIVPADGFLDSSSWERVR